MFAFILPLALTERATTDYAEVLAVLPRPLRWLVGNRWGIVVLGVIAGADSALSATWPLALGSAATTVVVGTAAGAVWFVGVVVRTLVGRGPDPTP